MKREWVLAALGCALLTGLFVAPWRPNPETVVTSYPKAMENHVFGEATVWSHALLAGSRNVAGLLAGRNVGWFDAPFLHPLSSPLATMDHRLTENVWGAPFFFLFDPLTARSWLILIGLFSTALAAYALGRCLTGSAWGGAAAAVLFGFGPPRGVALLHTTLAFTPWLPLALLALVAFIERPTRRRGAALAAAASALAVEHAYQALHVAVLLPVVLSAAVLRRRVPPSAALGAVLATAVLSAALLAPVARGYRRFHAATGIDRTDARVASSSADHLSWLTTSDGSLLFPGGRPVERQVPFPCGYDFPGLVVVGLAVLGARALGRRSPEAWIFCAAAALLSIGTGERLLWSLGYPPASFGPYALFRLFTPGRAFGTPAVVAPYVHIVFAAAGAFAAARLAVAGRRGAVVAAALLTLSFAEARRPLREVDVRPPIPRAAAAWIAAQPGDFAVAHLPMGLLDEFENERRRAVNLWTSAVHGRPTPSGRTSAVAPWHESIAAHLDRPEPGIADRLLRALGVRYVVVDGGDEGREVVERLRRAGLAEAHRESDAVVFEVAAAAPLPVTVASVQEVMMAAEHPHLDRPGRGRLRVAGAGAGAGAVGGRAAVAAGALCDVALVVENAGDISWCANGEVFGGGDRVAVGVRWWRAVSPGADPAPVDFNGRPLTARALLPFDLGPGETVPVRLRAFAPIRPGRYRVGIDLLVEGVAWFSPEDSPLLEIEVEVEPFSWFGRPPRA